MHRLVFSAWLCLAAAATAQEQVGADYSGSYLCKTIASGGVAPGNGDAWRAATFNVTDEAYVIKVTDTHKTLALSYRDTKARVYTVGIKQFGTQEKVQNCFGRSPDTGGAEVASIDGDMNCIYFATDYIFDFKLMRFQIMFRGGYMDPDGGNRDTPFVSVGKCEKID
ncbi:hypothetical protein [Sinorhizobium americanum]|uniref:Uncharacterized protein n=1 Tax=Sinorhizobium americanum TaxID=194963 RepID=A0A4R2BX22_9HYPH|nr:hypothetical protein [Sinorhizobium americanum]TCN32468.1 hypothetical protein EV184_104134 [Sinorhizobium americanum]